MSGIVGGNLGRGSGLIKAGAIDDNSVTLAKMAGLARGKLIYGDASGDPAALAVGSADEVLTHDGTDFDWAAGGSLAASVGFKAHRDAGNVSLSAATWAKLIQNAEQFDLGGDYDITTNYRFDVPTTGKYMLNAGANFTGLTDQDDVRLAFYNNGSIIYPFVTARSKQHASGTADLYSTISAYLALSSGDYIELYAYSNATNTVSSGQQYLSGFQVS